MREWSLEQNQAISEKGCSLLVSAGAGSGKTAVLVERIIRLVGQEGVDLDKFLVVTFTQAAASEMRERISEAILDQLDNHPEREEHLRRQLYMLKSASISTIHSFCTDILRNYFHIIGLDPQFRVADENEARLIKNEAMEELLESEYEKALSEFVVLAEMFSGSKNDQALADLIDRIHGFVHSLPRPWVWLKQQDDQFAADYNTFLHGPWISRLMKQLKEQVGGIRNLLLAARGLIEDEDTLQGYLKTIDIDLENTTFLQTALSRGPEQALAAFEQVQIPRLNRAGKGADEALKAHVKTLRDEAKASLVKLQKSIQGRSLAQWHQEINELYPCMLCLTRLVADYHSLYTDSKTKKSLLDFNDLEHLALKILENPMVADELRSKYRYIFVDEYQDSNLVQEYLIQSICREDNLFLVGDIKQSIYRFRLADPTLFLGKYRQYPRQAGTNKLRVDLLANYRSDSSILQAVNTIFRSIMSEDLGEMDYTEECCLHTGWDSIEQANMGNHPVKVTFIEKTSLGYDEDNFSAMETAELEARLVGKYIQDSLGQTILDVRTGEQKPLEYRDMVVLLRSTQNWGHIFWETLMEMGIPVYADINTGYFDAIEVKLLLNLLRIIDNKQQDIPLMSTMRSSIGGFSIEEMAEIRAQSPGASYYDALNQYAGNYDNQLSGKVSAFIDKLLRWQDRANFLPVDELIWEIIMESGYLYFVSALPGGEQRQGNVRILLDRARQFQTTSFSGLYHFISYLEKVEQSSGDMGVARTLGENDNLVRIMSIHKSKGLEFPLVIVPGLGKKFNTRDTAAPMLMHRELGFGPRFVDLELRCYHDTLARNVIKEQIRAEGLSEEMRILYVAMTRARNRLYLLGSVTNLEKSASKWVKPLDAFNLAKAGNYADWLGPVLIRHRDGEILRRCLPDESLVEVTNDDESRWELQLLYADELNHITNNDAGREDSKPVKDLLPGDEDIITRLDWTYPWQRSEQIPSKLSATQIRKIRSRENALPEYYQDIPALNRRLRYLTGLESQPRTLSAAEKGTIMHLVMQKLDLRKVSSGQEIKDQVNNMILRGIIDKSYADCIDIEKILAFFQSEIGKRAVSSPQVYRELPFNLLQEAGDVLLMDEHYDEKLLVQGVIDMCFVEDDDIILLDYKTDSIFYQEDIDDIIQKYRPQLDVYRQALETLMKRKVRESYLYLFSKDMTVRL